ncbi:hypothetical protein FDUTEX481_02529 [Tolypothrix sp. PCC 7601]|nr:hypothetical protein FDUTEX481_02529 [Tolypothrix sp. PCC 7601]
MMHLDIIVQCDIQNAGNSNRSRFIKNLYLNKAIALPQQAIA